ncbi:hypothetical protein [Streptomyces sp. NBC_01497]|uniref:hypothetical protein n=1 Tax=Streptomyces sp. NBC_01497 TaxID=2903885 RepID=UPI002E315A70|nr:hypothetical protein [Streptomyces sp. NBC_01497]
MLLTSYQPAACGVRRAPCGRTSRDPAPYGTDITLDARLGTLTIRTDDLPTDASARPAGAQRRS